MYKINGHLWKVVLLPKGDRRLSNTLGVCDGHARTIYIQEGLHPAKFKEVCQHEVAHSISIECGMPLVMTEEQMAWFCGEYADEITKIGQYICKNNL